MKYVALKTSFIGKYVRNIDMLSLTEKQSTFQLVPKGKGGCPAFLTFSNAKNVDIVYKCYRSKEMK